MMVKKEILKPDEMICGNCFRFYLEGMDEGKFAPCCLNPPQMAVDPNRDGWISSRPFAFFGHPMCQFGMVHPERKFKKEAPK
jgi:hypothetical protein